MSRQLKLLASVLLLLASALAKEPEVVMLWPPSGTPALRFRIGRFDHTSQYAGINTFAAEVLVENIWTKPIRSASFAVYLYDKNKVRVGDGYIQVSDLNPGQQAKLTLTSNARGVPVSLELHPQVVPPEFGPPQPEKKISMRVFSVPSGAMLSLDGAAVGTMPRLVNVSVGHHIFEFGKEGFANGRYEFDVDTDEASGGSITLELGGLSHDTIELRDGTVITGDLEEVTPTEVVVRIAGEDQHYDRNKVKRLLLVERESVPPAATSGPSPAPVPK